MALSKASSAAPWRPLGCAGGSQAVPEVGVVGILRQPVFVGLFRGGGVPAPEMDHPHEKGGPDVVHLPGVDAGVNEGGGGGEHGGEARGPAPVPGAKKGQEKRESVGGEDDEERGGGDAVAGADSEQHPRCEGYQHEAPQQEVTGIAAPSGKQSGDSQGGDDAEVDQEYPVQDRMFPVIRQVAAHRYLEGVPEEPELAIEQMQVLRGVFRGETDSRPQVIEAP